MIHFALRIIIATVIWFAWWAAVGFVAGGMVAGVLFFVRSAG